MLYDLVIFLQLAEKEWITLGYDMEINPLDDENSTCAILRGHLSNSWVLVQI